ncbi:MAG: TetR/AcrR family transcriptional regulator [Dehalococcoidales bacterium]|nr:TetR/AcrR family transcriptional regulator [Dehalococcoidales bacterium]
MQVRKSTLVRKREIIMAARKLIVNHGSENVTIRNIANEIDVSEGAIYKHFRSKREILLLLIDDIEQTMISDIEKNYDGEIKSIEVLENIVIQHISAIEQRKGVGFQVIAEIISLGDKKLNKKIYEVIKEYTARIKAILVEGKKTGIIGAEIDEDVTAQMFFSMTQGLVNLWSLSLYNFDLVSEFKSEWKILLKAICPAF